MCNFTQVSMMQSDEVRCTSVIKVALLEMWYLLLCEEFSLPLFYILYGYFEHQGTFLFSLLALFVNFFALFLSHFY